MKLILWIIEINVCITKKRKAMKSRNIDDNVRSAEKPVSAIIKTDFVYGMATKFVNSDFLMLLSGIFPLQRQNLLYNQFTPTVQNF